jgi:RNA polymerase sporulation-specific sigma factor
MSESQEMTAEQRKLAEDNMNLVHYLIGKEYPTYTYDEDIRQIGLLGLCKAAMKWDESKGAFSTFACKCIRNEIRLEFRNRQKQVETVSLETKIDTGITGDQLTLEDIIDGGEDSDMTEFTVESFMKTLTTKERIVYNLKARGYTHKEISDVSGYNLTELKDILKSIRRKYLRVR